MKYSSTLIIHLCILFASCGNNINDVKNTSGLPDTSINTIRQLPSQETLDSQLLNTWERFKKIVTTRDYNEFRKISLDSVEGCEGTFRVTKFIDKCFLQVFDTTLLRNFSEISYSDYNKENLLIEHLPRFLLKDTEIQGQIITSYRFQILKQLTEDGGWTMTFDFIKTRSGYKFYRCDSFGGPVCCR